MLSHIQEVQDRCSLFALNGQLNENVFIFLYCLLSFQRAAHSLWTAWGITKETLSFILVNYLVRRFQPIHGAKPPHVISSFDLARLFVVYHVFSSQTGPVTWTH